MTIAAALTVILALSHITTSAQEVLSDHQADSITAALPNMPDNVQKLQALYDLSRHYTMMDSIIKYSLSTYYLAKRLNNLQYVASSCAVIGWYYNTIGKYAFAAKYYKEAGEVFEALKKPKSQAMMLSGCGDAYIGMGKFEQGISYKQQALSFFQDRMRRLVPLG